MVNRKRKVSSEYMRAITVQVIPLKYAFAGMKLNALNMRRNTFLKPFR